MIKTLNLKKINFEYGWRSRKYVNNNNNYYYYYYRKLKNKIIKKKWRERQKQPPKNVRQFTYQGFRGSLN